MYVLSVVCFSPSVIRMCGINMSLGRWTGNYCDMRECAERCGLNKYLKNVFLRPFILIVNRILVLKVSIIRILRYKPHSLRYH